ncbi:MAG: FprA family A-type flavoprotein [Bacteroidales bacterium]|nr:FprA family A-type flavoprotein [Bacteroidales bacterium]
MKARKLKEGVYWVGAIDWQVRNFHGYSTPKGTTYNAYLIIDEKITLIDSVKYTHTEEMLSRISDVINPAKIDVIISNHVEPDHSGAISAIVELNPSVEVYACAAGVKGLQEHYFENWNFKSVKSGETISLGKRSLHFVTTPMVHWPDNMMTYMPEEKILFSNDAFGQHLGSWGLLDDEEPLDIIMHEAKKYYANIVLPYGKQVQKAMEVIPSIAIDMICTSHGIIWKNHIPVILEAYRKWSNNETEKKVVIAWDSMWNTTEKMAYAIYEAFELKGYRVVMRNLQVNHESDVMTDIIDAEYVCVGSPTLNHEMMTNVIGFLTYMRGLKPKNRKAFVFGSYGWSGQSVEGIETFMKDAGFDVKGMYKQKFKISQQELDTIKNDILDKI